jgi:hypothetical protein
MKRFIFLLLCGLFLALAVQARDVGPEPDVGYEAAYAVTQDLNADLPVVFICVDEIPVVGRLVSYNSNPPILIVIQNVYFDPDYGLCVNYCLINMSNQNNKSKDYQISVIPQSRHV